MNPVSIVLLGVAMSTDAFAAAVGKGAAMRTPQWRDALRAGLIFGAIEAITPLIGWALGMAAAPYVTTWDHWIAFTLLAVLGLRMIREGLSKDVAGDDDAPKRHGFWALATTGFATSIDAMAVGVGLAFIDANILVIASVIGFTTFAFVTVGVMLGRVVGRLAGKRAEIFGGLLLIGIGSVILYEHLGGAAVLIGIGSVILYEHLGGAAGTGLPAG